MKTKQIILSITLSALALLGSKELRAKCPIGVTYCKPVEKGGAKCPDCKPIQEYYDQGSCINGGTLDCDGVCQSHYTQQHNQQINYTPRVVKGQCVGCDEVNTVFTNILLNCPAADGICTNKTDCE